MIEAIDIVEVFDSEFRRTFSTMLVSGGDEPVYIPGAGASPARIIFKEDFAASALHEVAHWCLAGERRRKILDYGYWYDPERDACAQARFEAAEVVPQSLEWIFSVAAGRSFRVSCDNFSERIAEHEPTAFRQAVRCAAIKRTMNGLPPRARRFADRLRHRSGVSSYLAIRHYEELPL